MRIKVHRSAKVDLLEGKLIYDNQQLGLVDYFESSLESDIESLKLYAGIHPKLPQGAVGEVSVFDLP